MNAKKTTIDYDAVDSFSSLASDWWNQDKGAARMLHEINPIRLRYIKDHVARILLHPSNSASYRDIKLLDVGCGGGILTLPLANIGFNTTGIDASKELIKVAEEHAAANVLRNDLVLKYENISAEDLASKPPTPQYHLITALEIIEHVADLQLFIESCDKLLVPGGLMFFATINRNIKSFIQAILLAEYVLGWGPRGTHKLSQFVKPSEIVFYLHNYKIVNISGLKYSIIKREWKLCSDDTSVNYIMCVSKNHS